MKEINKIEIWSRGKNRDKYGNPYSAWIAKVHFGARSFFDCVTIHKSMTGGNSAERDCLMAACQGINEVFGTKISTDDKRIIHHYQHATRDAELENPTAWRLD